MATALNPIAMLGTDISAANYAKAIIEFAQLQGPKGLQNLKNLLTTNVKGLNILENLISKFSAHGLSMVEDIVSTFEKELNITIPKELIKAAQEQVRRQERQNQAQKRSEELHARVHEQNHSQRRLELVQGLFGSTEKLPLLESHLNEQKQIRQAQGKATEPSQDGAARRTNLIERLVLPATLICMQARKSKPKTTQTDFIRSAA